MADPVFVDDVTPLNAANMNKLQTRDEKAQANGYPSLGADGKVPAAQLPAMGGGGGGVDHKGAWAAITAYLGGDVVTYQGVDYIAVNPSTNVAPPGTGLTPVGLTPGAELASAQITASINLSGTSEATATTLITLPAIVCDGVTKLCFEVSAFSFSAGGSGAACGLFMDGVSIGQWFYQSTGTLPLAERLVITPSAGSHVFSIRGWSAGTAGSINAGTGGAGQPFPAVLRVSQVGTTPGQIAAVSYGTSLPATPLDGQEAILVDSLTNPTYQWRFRYNAGSSSPYKWEFVGGSPRTAYVDADQSTASTTYANLTTAGPSFTIPRAGDYIFHWQAEAWAEATGAAYTALKRGTAAASDNDAAIVSCPAGSTVHLSRELRVAGVTLGHVYTLQYKVNTGSVTGHWLKRALSVIPVRVA